MRWYHLTKSGQNTAIFLETLQKFGECVFKNATNRLHLVSAATHKIWEIKIMKFCLFLFHSHLFISSFLIFIYIHWSGRHWFQGRSAFLHVLIGIQACCSHWNIICRVTSFVTGSFFLLLFIIFHSCTVGCSFCWWHFFFKLDVENDNIIYVINSEFHLKRKRSKAG